MKQELVIITGGNSGLGLALTELFRKDHKVLVINRTKREEFENVLYEYGSISDEKFIKNLYDKYSKDYCITYLINNAATGCFGAPETNSLAKIQTVFDAGLIGLILNTTYALPLLNLNGAKIVNILSTAALKGNVNESLYCAAKWGARGYTESLKATFKGSAIKVVAVCPGGMNTNFWKENRDYVSEEKALTWLNPEDVAKTIFDNITNDTLNISEIVIERK